VVLYSLVTGRPIETLLAVVAPIRVGPDSEQSPAHEPQMFQPETEDRVLTAATWTRAIQRRETMKKYTLPELPYSYSALEPHCSARLLELHHGKHHAAYVAGANATLEKLAATREQRNFEAINQLQKNPPLLSQGVHTGPRTVGRLQSYRRAGASVGVETDREGERYGQ
jgi:hypothetical protein